MEDNLVGYLLKSLDSATHREVEEYLRNSPEGLKRLELLRRALAPLAEDKGPIELPPPGLRHATLARVAEYRCRDLPCAPPPPRSRSVIPIRSWWRWPDALVAAAILLITVSLAPLARYRLLHEQNVLACKNNLHQFHQALMTYASHHGGELPMVGKDPPMHIAGSFILLLNETQPLSKDLTVSCPSNPRRLPTTQSVHELRLLYHTRPPEFDLLAKNLGGCYAYCLGYRDEFGILHGLRRDAFDANNDRLPILADRPPFDTPATLNRDSNSQNHNGRGQNVLFVDGAVQFCTVRTVGINGDDIYLNKNNRLDAGLGRHDTVLGASAVAVGPR